MSEPVRAAIVGLGRVAWRFDTEPGRRVVWTHVGAYRAAGDNVLIVGASDPSPQARADFEAAHPGIPTFATAAEMAAKCRPALVSVCTPANVHAATLDELLASSSLRAVWCEKPLADSLARARGMVAECQSRGVALIVNHVRRWVPLWRRVKDMIDSGEVGQVRSIRVSMPNRLFSIGSHAIDLALMLGGPVASVTPVDIPALAEESEPARSALLLFRGGASGAILVTGLKDRLVVDVEIIGDKAMLTAREDHGRITLEPFVASSRFAGYFERGEPRIEHYPRMTDVSPFIPAAEEAIMAARGEAREITCGGADALETIAVLDRMAACEAWKRDR